VLKNEDTSQPFIAIFDIRRNSYVRRIDKTYTGSLAFCLDRTGRLLVLSDKEELKLYSVKIPNN